MSSLLSTPSTTGSAIVPIRLRFSKGKSIQKSRFAGWSSYAPRSVQVVDGGDSIVWANERGMVDKSFLAKKRGDVKTLWIGGAEVSASHLPEMLHAHSLAEKQFADETGKRCGSPSWLIRMLGLRQGMPGSPKQLMK